eukprot:gene14259-19133_t
MNIIVDLDNQENDPTGICKKSCSYAVLPYGYYLLYCAKYDKDWIQYLEFIQSFILSVIVMKRSEAISNTYKKKFLCGGSKIPNENIYHILSYLDMKSLLKCRLVNLTWSKLSNESKLWKNLLLKDFSVLVDNLDHKYYRKSSFIKNKKRCETLNPQKIYIQMYQTFKSITVKRTVNLQTTIPSHSLA